MDEKTTTIYQIIADNVLRLRGRMSQAELAEKAGVSRGTIANIETCRGISVGALVKVAFALGVKPPALLAPEGNIYTLEDFVRIVMEKKE